MDIYGCPIFNFDRLQRGVFSFSNSNIIRRQPLQTHYILFALFACSALPELSCVCIFERERERDRERERERERGVY